MYGIKFKNYTINLNDNFKNMVKSNKTKMTKYFILSKNREYWVLSDKADNPCLKLEIEFSKKDNVNHSYYEAKKITITTLIDEQEKTKIIEFEQKTIKEKMLDYVNNKPNSENMLFVLDESYDLCRSGKTTIKSYFNKKIKINGNIFGIFFKNNYISFPDGEMYKIINKNDGEKMYYRKYLYLDKESFIFTDNVPSDSMYIQMDIIFEKTSVASVSFFVFVNGMINSLVPKKITLTIHVDDKVKNSNATFTEQNSLMSWLLWARF